MRITFVAVLMMALSACTASRERFIPTGGNTNPYVMFDTETAQACYAGSEKALEAHRRALQDEAAQHINMSQPYMLREYLYPGGNKSNVAWPLTYASELERQASEFGRQAAEEHLQALTLEEIQGLPTCRKLAGFQEEEGIDGKRSSTPTRPPRTAEEYLRVHQH